MIKKQNQRKNHRNAKHISSSDENKSSNANDNVDNTKKVNSENKINPKIEQNIKESNDDGKESEIESNIVSKTEKLENAKAEQRKLRLLEMERLRQEEEEDA